MATLVTFTLFFLINCLNDIISGAPITITTELGEIKGNSTDVMSRTVYHFFGIKYGIPPIGNLRFRPSILNTSKWNGVYDASKFGAACIQFKAPIISEDCLYLNIYTTKTNVDNKNTKLVPVMFWIHGGGFIGGQGSDYDGDQLIDQYGDMVYVSINYRLGPLGFINNQQIYDEDPNWKSYGGSNGLYDQIIAMQWVKNYISDYGGDPNAVTIFGESAGGISVCQQLVSPLSTNLYQRAIIESGSCISPGWGPLNYTFGLLWGNQLLTIAGYPTDNITYLRSLPAKIYWDKVVAAANFSWAMSVDKLILTEQPIITFSTPGNTLNAKQGVIAGFNSIDGVAYWDGTAPTTNAEYKQFIGNDITNITQQDLIYSKYYPPSQFPPNNEHNSYQLAWFTINGDVCVLCPTLKLGEQVSTNKMTSSMYIYEFLGTGENGTYYAPHGCEIPFVFDLGSDAIQYCDMPWNQNVSDSMLSAWTNMAKFGTPNITNKYEKININWDLYDAANGNVIMFNDRIQNVNHFKLKYRDNACDFWYDEVGELSMQEICYDI